MLSINLDLALVVNRFWIEIVWDNLSRTGPRSDIFRRKVHCLGLPRLESVPSGTESRFSPLSRDNRTFGSDIQLRQIGRWVNLILRRSGRREPVGSATSEYKAFLTGRRALL